MPLRPGQALSHYEVLGALGAGGMGEVYRARDSRLDREVAIKVLPDELADDDERLRRFEREAKTLASLNHTNLAHVYGIDQVDDTCFIAMELVPGQDLAAKLARGPLPIDEAVDVCRQIAEGLEAAHEAGVVHRDLKPANVRVTPDGIAKVLDFGLAKPIRPRATKEGTTTAESDSFLATEEGLVLGTPTYMSPEQARGKPVDKRTDVWAFGCVLYECLTGKRAFGGESLTDILAAIVEREPDWSALPARTPAAVRRLLQRCLTKDPRQRLRDVGEARVTLQGGEAEHDEPAARAPARVPLVTAGLVAGVLLTWLVLDLTRATDASSPSDATTGVASDGEHTVSRSPRVRRFVERRLVDDSGERVGFSATFLSPDGRTLAATTSKKGLYVRPLDSSESRMIPCEGYPASVAWSPGGDALAYTDGRAIFRVPAREGATVRLYHEPRPDQELRGLAWLDDGRLVFASTSNEDPGILVRAIPADGGAPVVIDALDGRWGRFVYTLAAIPGGRFVAVSVRFEQGGSKNALVGVDSSGARSLLELDGMEAASWVPGGRLLLQTSRGTELRTWIVPFSTESFDVEGEPVLLEETLSGASVSADGTLAYIETNTDESPTARLAWWSPDGTVEPFGLEHEHISVWSYSARRDSILYATGTSMNPRDGARVYRFDGQRGVASEVTTGDLWAGTGLTLADGRIAILSVVFEPDRERARTDLLPASGRGAAALWQEGYVIDVSDDMRRAIVVDEVRDENVEYAMFVLDLVSGERQRIRSGLADIWPADISPDGDWLLLRSDVALLTRFPSGEGEWPVSPSRPRSVAFSPNGKTIYYTIDGEQRRAELYAVELTTEPEVVLGAPQLVGDGQWGLTPLRAADSERFLTVEQEFPDRESDVVVVQDWASRFDER